jgi:hypothetical protein
MRLSEIAPPISLDWATTPHPDSELEEPMECMWEGDHSDEEGWWEVGIDATVYISCSQHLAVTANMLRRMIEER